MPPSDTPETKPSANFQNAMTYIIENEATIPLYRGPLRPGETNCNPGPSLDLFLKLFNNRCRISGITSFESKKDKLIGYLDKDVGSALHIVINNTRLDTAKDWPSYEQILRSLFVDYNVKDIHSIVSEMIYIIRDPNESIASYEAKISAYIRKAENACILRGWPNMSMTLTFLAEVLLLGESNEKLGHVGLDIPAPQKDLNMVMDLLQEKSIKTSTQNIGTSLHQKLRKKLDEKPAQISSVEQHKCNKCRSTFHFRKDCPYSRSRPYSHSNYYRRNNSPWAYEKHHSYKDRYSRHHEKYQGRRESPYYRYPEKSYGRQVSPYNRHHRDRSAESVNFHETRHSEPYDDYGHRRTTPSPHRSHQKRSRDYSPYESRYRSPSPYHKKNRNSSEERPSRPNHKEPLEYQSRDNSVNSTNEKSVNTVTQCSEEEYYVSSVESQGKNQLAKEKVKVDVSPVTVDMIKMDEKGKRPYFNAQVDDTRAVVLLNTSAISSLVKESFIKDHQEIKVNYADENTEILLENQKVITSGLVMFDLNINGLLLPVKAHIVKNQTNIKADIILAANEDVPPVTIDFKKKKIIFSP